MSDSELLWTRCFCAPTRSRLASGNLHGRKPTTAISLPKKPCFCPACLLHTDSGHFGDGMPEVSQVLGGVRPRGSVPAREPSGTQPSRRPSPQKCGNIPKSWWNMTHLPSDAQCVEFRAHADDYPRWTYLRHRRCRVLPAASETIGGGVSFGGSWLTVVMQLPMGKSSPATGFRGF